MMKFYGNGTVWDKTNNKALCRFVNGELETDDRRTQRILESMGYRREAEKVKIGDPCETCNPGTEDQKCFVCELPETAITPPQAIPKKKGAVKK